MNPVKVFLSIFASGVLLAVILGIVGLYQQEDDIAGNVNNAGDHVTIDDVETFVQQSCINCHGQNLEGGLGPAVVGVGLTEEEIIVALREGPGSMPAYDDLSEDELVEVAQYLLSLE